MFKIIAKRIVVAIALTTMLGACGGGGGGGSSTTPSNSTGTTPTEPVYTAGEYKDSSEFKDQCAAPRSGIDPFTNEAYPDKAGSATAEKMYLRSFSHETYLWYDELPDTNPASYTVFGYFDHLRTREKTPSGADKDQFHFYRNTAEYNQETRSGASYGFGFNWKIIDSRSPRREWYIAYVDEGSPAADAGVGRGDRIMVVDGFAFADGNGEVLNAGLFPSKEGESHVFEFKRPDGETYEVTINSAEVDITVVDGVTVMTNSAERKVGYVRFNSFISPGQDPLIAAFDSLSDDNVSELIVDLRYNGGGLLAMSSQLAYMVAGDELTTDKVFEQSQYNDKRPSGDPIGFYDFPIDWELGEIAPGTLPSLDLERVYVLTTSGTCSASEAFINGLRGIDIDVRLIGDTTCGKPYGFVPQPNCGTTYFTVQFKGANAKGFGDYSDGFTPSIAPSLPADVPGCLVSDDVSLPLGTAEDALVSAALTHMVDGTCPAVEASRNVSDFEMFLAPDPVAEAYQRSRLNDRIDTLRF